MIDKSDIVFSRCKSALTKKYGKDIFVSSSKLVAPSKFPAIGITQLGAISTDETFTSRLCYVRSTMEIEVYSDQNNVEARKIMGTIVDTLDSIGYRLIYGPEPIQTDNNLIRYIARAERLIGSGDFF